MNAPIAERSRRSDARPADAPARPLRRAVLTYDGACLRDALAFERGARPGGLLRLGLRLPAVRTGCGARLAVGAELRPDAADPGWDALVVPCGFVESPDFESRAAIEALRAAIRGAAAVLFVAPIARQARAAHLLLREPPMMPPGRFWEALAAPLPEQGVRLVEDGRVAWMVGPGAVRAAARWIGAFGPPA